jgi:hypothetical protein
MRLMIDKKFKIIPDFNLFLKTQATSVKLCFDVGLQGKELL